MISLRNKRSRASAEVNTASLNDIMFFLLLFFLIASTISNPNVIKLLLPKSDTGQVLSKRTINVSINEKLEVFWEQEKIEADALNTKLSQIQMKGKEELTMVLYADKTVPIEEVIKVMDIANKNKTKIVLATESQK